MSDFSILFLNVLQDFEVDEFSQEYLALHPMAAPTKKPSLFDEHFETVAEEDEQSISGSDVPSGSESSEDEQTNNNAKSLKKSRVPRFLIHVFSRRFLSYFKKIRKNINLASRLILCLLFCLPFQIL